MDKHNSDNFRDMIQLYMSVLRTNLGREHRQPGSAVLKPRPMAVVVNLRQQMNGYKAVFTIPVRGALEVMDCHTRL
jgi:hypothetical protein